MNLDELYKYSDAIDRRIRFYRRNLYSRIRNYFKISRLYELREDVYWMIRYQYMIGAHKDWA